MKQLLIPAILLFSFTSSNGTELVNQRGSDSLEIKKWTKEDFINEFGINDTANALINLFFTKNKRAKNQTVIGGAFLIAGVTALAIPPEPNDDQKGFGDMARPVLEPGAVAIGAIMTTSAIVKLDRYTKQKLHILLSSYKKGRSIPGSYRKKLKQKYFYRR